MPREAPPPMPSDMPDSKRQRVGGEFVLQSEEEFMQYHPGTWCAALLCGQDRVVLGLGQVQAWKNYGHSRPGQIKSSHCGHAHGCSKGVQKSQLCDADEACSCMPVSLCDLLPLFALAGPSKVRVQCPEVEGNDKLVGQLLEVEVASLKVRLAHGVVHGVAWGCVTGSCVGLRMGRRPQGCQKL